MTDEDGNEYIETNDILKFQKEFYQKLYSKNEEINANDTATMIGDKLSDSEAANLEGEIKYTELVQTLKSMKNEKSPGQDGFTTDFFLIFLD